MKKLILLLAIFISVSVFGQNNKTLDNIDFNGYIQVRGVSNFNDYSGFMLRRLKLWVKSKPEFSKHWSYKIQTTFTSLHLEQFFLQDVKIGYKTGQFSFDIGQFVPQYSLQRFQGDSKIPTIERATPTNILIPNGTLGARDIGLQANFASKNSLFETHLGVFNGYGIVNYHRKNKGYMITNKSAMNIPINDNKLKIGYSIQYRKAENLQFRKLLADSILFTGNDLRYDLFAFYKSKLFEIQAEYLAANLEGQLADGYYIVSAINIKKSQLVASFEDYNDLIDETTDRPYYRLGYNYLIKGNKIKLAFDNYFQINGGNIENYIASIQLQVFLK